MFETSFETASRFHRSRQPFNMTPIIDVVFLLIIFFSVVCRFIEAENFPVVVPDNCSFADDGPPGSIHFPTVTVVKGTEGQVNFAVGSKVLSLSAQPELTERIAGLLDIGFKDFPPTHRVVSLRIDKDICFTWAQYALAGIAASSATDIRLAVLKDEQMPLQ